MHKKRKSFLERLFPLGIPIAWEQLSGDKKRFFVALLGRVILVFEAAFLLREGLILPLNMKLGFSTIAASRIFIMRFLI